eukprot:5219026-Prymnesium_polylepis.1
MVKKRVDWLRRVQQIVQIEVREANKDCKDEDIQHLLIEVEAAVRSKALPPDTVEAKTTTRPSLESLLPH